MGVKSIGQVTVEGTNAAGDKIEATSAREADADSTIAELVHKARAAMGIFEHYDQEQVNEVVQAVGWAIIKRENAEELARLAVEDTDLGKYEDKVTKIVKPVGVVAAVTPSTNPAATPANKTIRALKGRNAIIIAPSPKGASTCELLLRYIHEELSKIGAPLDLVQALPRVDKELAHELMKQADFVTDTGSANNVRAGQTSGTPNACVSAGNVISVVDTVGIEETVRKIRTSKTFAYGTSCSNDNSIVIEAPVYEIVEALKREGGYLCDDDAGVDLVLNQFRGIVTNAEADSETVGRLSDACAAVQEDPDFTEFQEQNFSTPESYQDAEEFTEYIQTQADTIAELQQEFGSTGQ